MQNSPTFLAREAAARAVAEAAANFASGLSGRITAAEANDGSVDR